MRGYPTADNLNFNAKKVTVEQINARLRIAI
jgi:hypothetical protein